MKLNWIDWLGDCNPQLLREIKGRFQLRNLAIAGAISVLGQFLLLMYFQNQLPMRSEGSSTVYSKYCIGNSIRYRNYDNCLTDSFGNFSINWELWWQDVFVWLGLMGIFVLLIGGTYLLISDLAYEEHRDTLNFIRLSPQSPQSILVGKLLGVPILLYLVAGLAVPLHLSAGMAAYIPTGEIFSLYGIVIASCIFFYSTALLFGFVSSWLGGFQAWLGSGTVLIFLWSSIVNPITHTPADWLKLFSPASILQNLVAANRGEYYQSLFFHAQINKLQWFHSPLGASTASILAFALLNYALWTYWSWQALQRRFPNPSKAILSKRQSYLLVACFEVMAVGFAATTPKWPYSTELSTNYNILLVCNIFLFLGLIVALTPQRQVLQDWARYRRERVYSPKSRDVACYVFTSQNLVRDLIWGEKSPALLAIALNLAVVAAMLVPWIVFVLQDIDKLPAFLGLAISLNLILIYAAIAQLLVFMKTQKHSLWITSTVGAVTLLPPFLLSLLSLSPYKAPALWLFTPFAWTAIEQASTVTICLSILGQWSILILSTLQITRQVQRVGESASKALFAGQPSLPSS